MSAGEWPSCACTNNHGILISVALQHHAVTLDLILAAFPNFPSHQSDCNCLSENRFQLCCAQHKICCTAAIFCNALHQAVGNAPAKAHLKRIGSSLWRFIIFSCAWFSRIFKDLYSSGTTARHVFKCIVHMDGKGTRVPEYNYHEIIWNYDEIGISWAESFW